MSLSSSHLKRIEAQKHTDEFQLLSKSNEKETWNAIYIQKVPNDMKQISLRTSATHSQATHR